MNKVLTGILITGAAAAAVFAVTKFLGKDNSQTDYDDDIYDYPDPYDTDESIDFEIDEDALAEDVEKAEDAVEDAADKVEEIVEDAAEAVEDAIKED